MRILKDKNHDDAREINAHRSSVTEPYTCWTSDYVKNAMDVITFNSLTRDYTQSPIVIDSCQIMAASHYNTVAGHAVVKP
jgi:hypothetical protein